MALRIYVKVITRSSKPGVVRQDRDRYTVKVVAIPERGKANKEVCQRLAEYFSVNRSAVSIIQGHRVKDKIIDITV